MASEVLSGAANASYTNNTGQNVRLVINYMSNTTSMTWAGVNVTASSTTIGKDIQNITGEFRGAATGKLLGTSTSPLTSDAIYTYELNLTNKKLNLSEQMSFRTGAVPPKTVPAPNRVPSAIITAGAPVSRGPSTPLTEPRNMLLTQENSLEYVNVAGAAQIAIRDTTDYNPALNFGTVSGIGIPRMPYSIAVDGEVSMPNIFYVPLTVSRGGNFPAELMLSNGQAFSAVCGAFNAIVIKEDGT